jgi:hypothetical protein
MKTFHAVHHLRKESIFSFFPSFPFSSFNTFDLPIVIGMDSSRLKSMAWLLGRRSLKFTYSLFEIFFKRDVSMGGGR